jgi:hypothetical protein
MNNSAQSLFRLVPIVAVCVLSHTNVATLVAAPLVPAGLLPGDKYHIAFVTRSFYVIGADESVPPKDAHVWGGIGAADYLINEAASDAGYLTSWNSTDTTWKAIISTSNQNARDRFEVLGPIYNTIGELVATDATDLWDGSLRAPIQYTESGMFAFNILGVLTGTNQYGAWSGNSADDWSDPTAVGTAGVLDATNSDWVSAGNALGGLFGRLYGISPPLTVPITEPCAITLVALTGMLMANRQSRVRLASCNSCLGETRVRS